MPFPNDPVLSPLLPEHEEQEQYLSLVRQLMKSRETTPGRTEGDAGEHAVGGYPD